MFLARAETYRTRVAVRPSLHLDFVMLRHFRNISAGATWTSSRITSPLIDKHYVWNMSCARHKNTNTTCQQERSFCSPVEGCVGGNIRSAWTTSCAQRAGACACVARRNKYAPTGTVCALCRVWCGVGAVWVLDVKCAVCGAGCGVWDVWCGVARVRTVRLVCVRCSYIMYRYLIRKR